MVYTEMSSPEIDPSPAVDKWLNSVGPNTRPYYKWHFETFMKWVRVNGDEKFRTMSPDDMVEYVLDATPREINAFLDLKKQYIQSKKGTKGFKGNSNKAIQSFFMHNRAPLPRDSTLNIQGDRAPVNGELKPEEIRDIALASSRLYRTVTLCMFTAGMGQEEFFYWSDNGHEDLQEQLDQKLVKINMIGRKLAKYDHPYITFLGGDALETLREYLNKTRPHTVERCTQKYLGYSDPGTIFLNQRGDPLSKNAFRLYWRRVLKKLDLINPEDYGDESTRYGKGAHEMRDTFRTLWRKSGVDVEYAEYFMGHVAAFDKYGYDKTYLDERELREKYVAALPFLNLISESAAYGLVDKKEFENDRIRELENQIEAQQEQIDKLLEAFYESRKIK